MKSYRYAVIASPGMHGQSETVWPILRTDDLARARNAASRATRNYQRGMAPHGGSGGYYRVVAWDSDDRNAGMGMDADRTPSIDADHDYALKVSTEDDQA